jgi:hypothetical protein
MPKNRSLKIKAANRKAQTRRNRLRSSYIYKRDERSRIQNAAFLAEQVVLAAGVGLDRNVNLEQVEHIVNRVADNVDRPEILRETIRNETEKLKKCSDYKISLNRLFYVIMTIVTMYALKVPTSAAPRDPTFFDTAAGYYANVALGAGFLSLESAGIFTTCSIATKLAGTTMRFFNDARGRYPMTNKNRLREIATSYEYMPGFVGKSIVAAKAAAIAANRGYNLYKGKPLVNTVKKAATNFTKVAPDVVTNISSKRFAYNESE